MEQNNHHLKENPVKRGTGTILLLNPTTKMDKVLGKLDDAMTLYKLTKNKSSRYKVQRRQILYLKDLRIFAMNHKETVNLTNLFMEAVKQCNCDEPNRANMVFTCQSLLFCHREAYLPTSMKILIICNVQHPEKYSTKRQAETT